MSTDYEVLVGRMREIGTLQAIGNLLAWDQETMMPRAAATFRADELSLLSRLTHQRATDPELGELIERCAADAAVVADEARAANLRELRRDFQRARKLPETLVAEISETSSRALEAWKRARRDKDFSAFQPWLAKQIGLARRKADCYGFAEDGEAYDALLDDFEPGMTARELERIFGPLRDELAPLIKAIAGAGRSPDQGPNEAAFPIAAQRKLSEAILQRLGFDMAAGRLDVSTHPFSSGVAPGDTRLTTRYSDTNFPDALGSTMHEAGHALYEQGLPKQDHPGQPLSEATSLGIHESQSRLWENHVGRSREFWTWALPLAKEALGAGLAPFDADALYQAINTVEPHPIRVESDEATYNLHIMIRFDLERAMVRGDLAAADLPGAWNERMKADLGLVVPDDARGCLQDIHWAMGAVGYFPSYTLGNLYAAQLWETSLETMPDLPQQLERGEFAPLLTWLRENVHVHGRRYPAAELCRRITGSALDHRPLMRHLRDKLGAIYGLEEKSYT